MSNQLLRTALVSTLLLSASVRLPAAETRSAQQQIDSLRQQQAQAMAKGDFVTAARHAQELKALEANVGAVAAPALTPAPAPLVPASSSFFAAPANAPVPAPAGSSSAFNLPASTGASFTAPPRTVASPAPAFAAPAPTPAPFVAPAAPVVTSTPATPRPPAPFSPLTAAPSATEEPRPAELPPAVLEMRAAETALSKLEEFRMAESQTSRRSTPSPIEPARPSLVPPPSAVFAPATPAAFAPTPSVNLTGAPDEARRRLDDLTRRRAELQAEADRLAKDTVDWEARYNAAKAELARLETENKGRDRLQTIREEIARLDTDATRLMQELEATRADQDRRARELIGRPDASPSLATLLGRDRAMVPGSVASPERKGPPQFLPVGTSRPAAPAPGEGNIVRTGRASVDTVALTRDLDRLAEKKELILREMDDVQQKFQYAERELNMATRTGQQADMDRWSKERVALDARYKSATSEFARVEADIQSKLAAMKGAVTSDDPDMVNPGDKLRLIVAEDDAYNAIYPVKRDGSIAVKNVGKLAVGGKQISEVEAMIKAALEESQLTKATVTLEFEGKVIKEPGTTGGPSTTDAPIIIYIAGEFITPGPLKIPEGVSPTLITTIIRSGGITPSGDLTRTKLLRIENGQGAVEEVNVAAILSGNIPPTDIALNSGDIIMIPAFAPVVYVTGNVNKPGTLRLFQDETLTAYSAILRAGGFSRFANLKKCTVVRDLGNGEKMQMPLNVKDIQKGLAPDIVLQGRDIVVIPESFFSF